MVLIGTQCKRIFLVKRKQIETVASRGSEDRMRERVLGAAFSAFQKLGYAGASTIEIATRAKVSKRELYRLFGNKRAMLTACIIKRARHLKGVSTLSEIEAALAFSPARNLSSDANQNSSFTLSSLVENGTLSLRLWGASTQTQIDSICCVARFYCRDHKFRSRVRQLASHASLRQRSYPPLTP